MNLRTTLNVFFAVLALITAHSAWSNPTIEDFLREPDLRDAELSPDGKHLAMIINETDKRKVVVINVETPDMPVIGAFSEDIIRPSALYWGNNNRLLIAMAVPLQARQVKLDKKRHDFDINNYYMISRMVAVDKDMKNLAILLEDEGSLNRNVSLSRVTSRADSRTGWLTTR